MQANNHLEEGTCDRHGNVGVVEGDEAGVFGEAIDHCDDNEFPMHLGQVLNEIHWNVDPHLRQHVKGLEQTH